MHIDKANVVVFFLIMMFVVLTGNRVISQERSSLTKSKHKIGFVAGYGTQSFGRLLSLNVDYKYNVHFFQVQYYYTILGRQKWSLELLAQPQYNIVNLGRFDDLSLEITGYEFGLNLGLLARKRLFNEFMSIYALLGVGPQYISLGLPRQSSGFIISSNLFAGVTFRVINNAYLDFRGGIRHLSNAGIKQPNAGINAIVLSMGFIVVL